LSLRLCRVSGAYAMYMLDLRNFFAITGKSVKVVIDYSSSNLY
jgi:hypothetical protein